MILTFPARQIQSPHIPEEGDQRIVMPPTLIAVTEMPGLLTLALAGSGFTPSPICDSGGIVVVARTQPASSATVNVNVVQFVKGLYHIHINATHLASFAPAAPLTSLFLSNPAFSQTFQLLNEILIANVPFTASGDFYLNFGEDGWNFFLQQGITAAGQTITSSVTVMANRLA